MKTFERYSGVTSDPGADFAESLLFVAIFLGWMAAIWIGGVL